jgi:hypothetical protein
MLGGVEGMVGLGRMERFCFDFILLSPFEGFFTDATNASVIQLGSCPIKIKSDDSL